MSITAETAKQHEKDPAVLCCRVEEGTILTPANFEDPAIFPDLIDTGLLDISGALMLGQVLNGTKMMKTVDSLTPITADIVDRYDVLPDKEEVSEIEFEDLTPVNSINTVVSPASGGVIKLHIEEGKDIDIQIPTGITAQEISHFATVTSKDETVDAKPIVAHELVKYIFSIKNVKLANETKIENDTLYIRKSLEEDAMNSSPIIKDVQIDLITPDNQDVYTNSMMDICPIATKKEGELGEGVTFELGGVIVMLTGVEESGTQCADAASSDGIFSEKVVFGRPGCPDKEDVVIRVHVVIENGYQMERPGPMAAHKAADMLTQEIREVMKVKLDEENASEKVILDDVKRPGKPKILYIKEIMGQGAMHDNLILPTEPCGYIGARPNVDLGNVPVFLRVNEVRDGGIHALTCITPDTKETTRLYWREPIVKLLAEDPEFDFLGVVFVGSPQANTEKFYVSKRIGATVEALRPDGVIVSTEGFGNNHVDFAAHIEEIGKQDIPVVGTSFCGIQGALVVGNKYMDAMVDMCVSDDGWETDNLCENQMTPESAERTVAMLKNKMAGIACKPANRSWEQAVADANAENIREVEGK